MKKLMRIACGILIVLSPTALSAQQEGVYIVHLNEEVEEPYHDTLVINLGEHNKMLFIGNDFKEMKAYTKADSLKTLFIADWEKAVAAGTLKQETQKVYYFIDPNGKRRLKAENPEYSENSVDVAYEMKRLRLGLARYEYRVYDMKTGYRLEFYLDDPAQLKTVLGGTSINEALAYMQSELKKDLKRNYKIELAADNNTYKLNSRTRGRNDVIEAVPTFGLGVLGNTVAPVVGADLWLGLTNKHSVPTIRVGVGITSFPFVKSIDDEVTGVSFVNAYDVKFGANIGKNRNKPHWLGWQLGMMASDLDSYNKARKLGVFYEGSGPFNYSIDFIRTSNNVSIYGLTLKIPF